MVQHWGADGTPTWAAPKSLAIFILPLTLAVLHIIVATIVTNSSSVQNNPKKIQNMVLWLVPAISAFTNLAVLLANLNANLNIGTIIFPFVGLLFIVIGNYLPKTRQNYFIGIRVPWTLNNTDNWHKTHKLAGKTCILGGFLFMIGAAVPQNQDVLIILFISALLLIAVIPITYSYMLHREQKKHNR